MMFQSWRGGGVQGAENMLRAGAAQPADRSSVSPESPARAGQLVGGVTFYFNAQDHARADACIALLAVFYSDDPVAGPFALRVRQNKMK